MLLNKITILFSCLFLGATAHAAPKFWTWTGYNKNKDWEAYFGEMKAVGVTGFIMTRDKAAFEQVIPIADQVGVDVYAWMWILNNRSLAQEHPEWLDYNQKGESLREKKAYVDYYKFLNPAIPQVQDAIVQQVEEIASIEGLKGVSLDYCRFVDAILPTTLWKKYDVVQDRVYPEWDYGYHPVMIGRFKETHGYDPRRQENPALDETWRQFRMDQVNELVFKLKAVTRKHGVELTASPFPTPGMSRHMLYQDRGKWPLDRSLAMIFDGFYDGNLDCRLRQDCRRDMDPNEKLYFGVFVPGD
ncbi:hypothetical protein [Pontiella sp.]|uniref:hypothetical protein n=1 Tax=Pontiella sp. TaxID=2837462 RepID=UPI003567D40B